MNRSVWWPLVITVLRYGILAVLIMLVLWAINPELLPLEVSLLFALFFGVVVGAFYEFFGFGFTRRWPFIPRLLVALIILQGLVMFTLVINRLALKSFSLNLTDDPLIEVLFRTSSITFYYKTWVFGIVLLFLIEVEKSLGSRYLLDLALGQYRKPKREIRVLLFLDLADSTALAETLGDDLYYSFINDCFRLIHAPVIRNRGEVLKYVGDEVIISWNDSRAKNTSRFLDLFTDFRKSLEQKRSYFLETYGEFPHFRAGAHRGPVVVAYIGDSKKQKDLNGDAMNTTARITSLAKKLDTDLVISRQLFELINERAEAFEGPLSETVKGKIQSLELYRLRE